MGQPDFLQKILILLLPLLTFLPLGSRSDSPPKWEWEPAALLELAEDENAELECPARGRPQPLIRWSFNTVPFHQLPEDGRRFLLDGGRLLRVTSLKRDLDTGLYQCNATNSAGHLAASTFLNVQAFAPRFGHSDQRVWKVLRNSRVDLNCDVQAAPRPQVRWVDANNTEIQPVPGKLELLANHTLRIHSLGTGDDGFYYCNVSNKYGLNRAMNRLEVFTPTFFAEVPQPAQLTRDAHASVELRCRAVADPRLAVDYVWTRNGRPAEERARMAEDGTSLLAMPQLRGHASGRIECAAVTDVDVKQAAMELLVRDVPSAPELLRVDCSSGQHALLVWRRPDDHGSALTAFTVEAKAQQRQLWEKVFEERLLGEEAMMASSSRKEIHRTAILLQPWNNYTFRLLAHNEHGPSEPTYAPTPSAAQAAENNDNNRNDPNNNISSSSSSTTAVCSTPEAVPFQNPTAVAVAGTEPDNLVIRWQPLARERWNAPGLKYLIRYRRADLGEKAEEAEWNEFFVEDPYANQTTIREQPTFRPYQVQVRAVNSRGFSPVEPDIVLGWSGEDVPLESPRDLRVLAHHNFSTVLLQWEPVQASSLRGHFLGYRLDFWLSSRPLFVHSLMASNSSTSLAVTGLEALHNYTAKVHAMNGQHESGPSNLMQFRTREGAPSKVHNLRVDAVGARSVLVTWEPPLHPNGNLRGFFLAFENGTSGRVEETYVLHRQQFYLHELLSPKTPFRVAVWAETGGGEGPRLWRHTRTWPLRDPDPPLFTLRSISTSSIRVQWLPAGNGSSRGQQRMTGTAFAVNYSRQQDSTAAEGWAVSEWIRLPQTQLELGGLEEGVDYWLLGLAREGPQWMSASKQPLGVRTESARSAPPFSRERLRSAAWFLAVLIASSLVLALAGAMCALAQRSAAGGVPSMAAIQLRDKKFGHAFLLDGRPAEEEVDEADGAQWLTELDDGPRNFLLDRQQKRGGVGQKLLANKKWTKASEQVMDNAKTAAKEKLAFGAETEEEDVKVAVC